MKATAEQLQYLDALRASGVINMFGATPYIEAEFGLNRKDAKAVLLEWMQTFEGRMRRGEVIA